MKNTNLLFSFIFFFSFFYSNANDIPDDTEYYNKGISLYKNAEFDDAFIIFYNLSEKGDTDAQFNITNMYSGGVGTPQNFYDALKWGWLCALGGEKKCFKKIENLKLKLDEKSLAKLTIEISEFLENRLYKNQDISYALRLGFWHEKFSTEIDLEKAYVWYSVAVTGGLYKAMQNRNNVGQKIESETIIQLQQKASKIYSEIKYFGDRKGG